MMPGLRRRPKAPSSNVKSGKHAGKEQSQDVGRRSTNAFGEQDSWCSITHKTKHDCKPICRVPK